MSPAKKKTIDTQGFGFERVRKKKRSIKKNIVRCEL